VPRVGDAFDIVFRTNMRNLALLKKQLARIGIVDAASDPIIEGEAIRVP
jgi:hypothetical protein